MARALDKGVMKSRMAVKLEVIKDSTTGMAVNMFTYRNAEKQWGMILEIANLTATRDNGETGFVPYDSQRDGKHGEDRRLELEATL